MLEIGLKHQSVMRVMDGNTAEYIGSGDMAVLATPRIAAFKPGASPPDVKIPKRLTFEFPI